MATNTVDSKRDRYLLQCWSAVHHEQTLALDFELAPSSENKTVPALTLHSPYSRYVLGLIDNTGSERKIVRVNIRADEVPYLLQEYDLAVQDKRQYLRSARETTKAEAPSENVSKAYTVKIRVGIFKGQTPADILLADPGKVEELERTRDWLAENLSKYPANQDSIDAIDDASYLLSTGQLTSEKAQSQSVASCVVFDERFKITGGGPDKRIRHEITITCEFENDSPWSIRICNVAVPVINGKPDIKKVLSQCSSTIHLNDKEMAAFIEAIRTTKLLFENHVFADAYEFVQQNKWDPAKEAAIRYGT